MVGSRIPDFIEIHTFLLVGRGPEEKSPCSDRAGDSYVQLLLPLVQRHELGLLDRGGQTPGAVGCRSVCFHVQSSHQGETPDTSYRKVIYYIIALCQILIPLKLLLQVGSAS